MKKRNVAWSFLGGIVFGFSLALCLAAADKKVQSSTPDWSRLKLVAYGSGATGVFDPQTGKLYLYDANVESCYAIRELKTLGEPMVRIRN